MVMMGRTVQSTTQRREAMLDILRRRSNNLDFLSVVLEGLLASSIGIASLGDDKRAEVDEVDDVALGLVRKDGNFVFVLRAVLETLVCVIL
jgi:hypothetical protein